jgi:hypothetical protein
MVGEHRGSTAGPMFAQLGGSAPYVCAAGVEYLRNTRAQPNDAPGLRLEPASLLARYGLPPLPRLVERASDWLTGLSRFDGTDVLVLLYIELKFGGWAGPLTLGFPDACTYTAYPLGHRTIADVALRLPWKHRQSDLLRKRVTETRWPELLEFPLNRRPLRTRLRGALQRRAHSVARIATRG